MAKNTLCVDCENNNNGWCKARKTNKGLKDLSTCEFKKNNTDNPLDRLLELKIMELKVDNTPYNRGFIKGIETAMALLKI